MDIDGYEWCRACQGAGPWRQLVKYDDTLLEKVSRDRRFLLVNIGCTYLQGVGFCAYRWVWVSAFVKSLPWRQLVQDPDTLLEKVIRDSRLLWVQMGYRYRWGVSFCRYRSVCVYAHLDMPRTSLWEYESIG